jgi:CDP-diacylglycerol---serine O-phosphatidyltransferase
MFLIRNIPNSLTLGNLVCGCLAIIHTMNGDLTVAAYLVGLAAVLDFFDGFVARLLKVSSPLGKDLDSLADMVTFGVVPGLMMFKMIANAQLLGETRKVFDMLRNSLTGQTNDDIWLGGSYLPYIALLIPVFSCIRLAKFNNDTRQTNTFIGLPTPANGIFIASLPLVADQWTISSFAFLLPHLTYILVGITLLMSFLLVSPLPMIAFKFKNFKWRGNEVRYVFLAFCVVLSIFFKLTALPLLVISYILFSIINNLIPKHE